MTTVREALEGAGLLGKNVIGARCGDQVVDLHSPVPGDGDLQPIKASDEDEDALHILRHSAAHVMASVVQELWPGTQVTIGPTIRDGFYYDFDRDTPFSQDEFGRIEEAMRAQVEADLPVTRVEVPVAEAIEKFRAMGESYKVEIIEDLVRDQGVDAVSLYAHGDWVDLCRGPHVPRTGLIKAFKLLTAAGAYWRGNERNPMLQRIYGTAFFTPKSLRAHEKRLEELEKRDHRKLGAELDLFSTMGDLGPGLILWHPKGGMIRKIVEDFWRDQHIRGGYDIVYTPHIAKLDLWETSGHTGFYRESMFGTMDIDGLEYQLRPMNCPFHILMYRSRLRSYRELPMRWAELGADYRYEKSGVLHGLLRVRGFTMDDAHLFVRPDQLDYEIRRLVRFSLSLLRAFGFDRFDIYLSTRPEKSIGSDQVWEDAEAALRSALEDSGLPWEVDEGGGAFYGPKIDIKIRDALERAWQCTTIQVDFNLPERFDLTFTGEDGKKHRPIMMHRALLGSLERFFGVLIEHHAGAFPAWLAPLQVVVMNVTDRQEAHVRKVESAMREAGLRVRADTRSDKLGAKIRDARLERVPYMAVVGDREVEGGGVALRGRQEGDMGFMTLDQALDHLRKQSAMPEIPTSEWEPDRDQNANKEV